MRWLCLTALMLASGAAHAERLARGTVFHDRNGNAVRDGREPGIARTPVSNGADIVLTDADGRWQLPVGEKFSIFVFGDPQPSREEHVDFLVRDVVAEVARVQGPVLGISLDDIVGDDLSLYAAVNDAIGLIGLPWYKEVFDRLPEEVDRVYRLMSEPQPTDHLWKAALTEGLSPGFHMMEVRALDRFGTEYSERIRFRVRWACEKRSTTMCAWTSRSSAPSRTPRRLLVTTESGSYPVFVKCMGQATGANARALRECV